MLTFWNYHYIERSFDRAYLQVSVDNGVSWTTLTNFDNSVTSWTQRTYSLTAYKIATQFKIRWAFNSDSSVTYPGWYIDDVVIKESGAPIGPALPSKATDPIPADNATSIPSGGTNLSWSGSATEYDVYLDTVNPPFELLEGSNTSKSSATGALQSGTYYWRVNSRNAAGTVLGDVWQFTVN